MADSTISETSGKARKQKPAKPHPDYPLTPRDDGRWAKKIKGKVHIFSGTAAEALAEYLRVKDDLLAGREPSPEGFSVHDLCNHFLNAKRGLVATGEITARTFSDYFATCNRLIKACGKSRRVADLRPDDFDRLREDIAKNRNPVSLGNEVSRVRVVLKYGFDAGLLGRPVRYGPLFKRPSKKVLRKERAKRGTKMLEAKEILRTLHAAGPQLKAMILLGINCGFGNADVAHLPISAVDLKKGWIEFPRPKTGIARKCKLWPETIKRLRAAIESRPKPKGAADASLCFVTKYGQCWAKTGDVGFDDDGKQIINARSANPISAEFRKLLNTLKLHRRGIGFYTLRHAFETIAGETADQVAVDHIMGHARDDMASVYRERISDERLEKVADFVRSWLFPKAKTETPTPKKKANTTSTSRRAVVVSRRVAKSK